MDWTEINKELNDQLHLRTEPIAYKRFEKETDLEKVQNVFKPPYPATFCQVVFMARLMRLTVGITKTNSMVGDHCMRVHGTQPSTEESLRMDAEMLATTWFRNPEEAYQQLRASYRIPPGEAVVLAPLSTAGYEPDVVLIFGNTAQMAMLMSGMQKEKYERFDFSYSGEGACADSLARCYVTGKPSLAIPCFGERSLGQVADDELVLAMPPREIERAISGMKTLSKIGFGLRYPIIPIGGFVDVVPALRKIYPAFFPPEER